MKKIFILISLVVAFVFSNAQNVQELQTELSSMKTKIKNLPYAYEVDDTSLKYQEIFEFGFDLPKDKLYSIIKNYIVSHYGDANKVIQTDDRENGKILVKGLFADMKCGCESIFYGGSAMKYTATHIMQIDIKDYRIRLTLTITQVKQESGGTGYGTAYYVPLKFTDFYPTQFYPFRTDCTVWSSNHSYNWYPKENSKKQYQAQIHEIYVLYNILLRANATISSVYKACTTPQIVQDNSDEW